MVVVVLIVVQELQLGNHNLAPARFCIAWQVRKTINRPGGVECPCPATKKSLMFSELVIDKCDINYCSLNINHLKSIVIVVSARHKLVYIIFTPVALTERR